MQIEYKNAVPSNALPTPLGKHPVTTTTNPLRSGEPNRSFLKAANLWDEQPKSSDDRFTDYLIGKEFENIAVCAEDIDHLVAMLMLLRNASDYSQKLLGKYMILELHSVAACFVNVGRASVALRTIADSYRKKLDELDTKHQFADIRNKIAAHRHDDGRGLLGVPLEKQYELWNHITFGAIGEYVDNLKEHLNMLENLHPNEFKLNITMNGQPLSGIDASPGDPNYIEFLDFGDEDNLVP